MNIIRAHTKLLFGIWMILVIVSNGLLAHTNSFDPGIVTPRDTARKEKPEPDFYDSFEKDGQNVSPIWKHSGNKKAHIVEDTAREGSKAVKFEIVATESVNFRDELVFRGNNGFRIMPMGSEWWIGMSFFVPKDWKADEAGEIVFQVHHTSDPDDATANPPIAFRIQETWAEFHQRWTPQDPFVEKKYEISNREVVIPKIVPGKWYDMVYHFVWADTLKAGGLTEVFIDNKRVYKFKGPNNFIDKKGPYIKYGIYKSLWKKPSYVTSSWKRRIYSRTYLFDNVRVYKGAKGFDAVKPQGAYSAPIFRGQPDANAINMYPNPVQDFLFVERPEAVEGELDIEIFDVSGRTIKTTSIPTHAYYKQINIQNLTAGLYTVRMNIPGKTLNGKLVIQ